MPREPGTAQAVTGQAHYPAHMHLLRQGGPLGAYAVDVAMTYEDYSTGTGKRQERRECLKFTRTGSRAPTPGHMGVRLAGEILKIV